MTKTIKQSIYYLVGSLGSLVALTAKGAAGQPPIDQNIDINTAYNRLIQVRDIVFGGGLLIAVIIFVIGGIQYMTAGGDDDKISAAKQKFIWGLVGAGIIVASWALITLVASFIFNGNTGLDLQH